MLNRQLWEPMWMHWLLEMELCEELNVHAVFYGGLGTSLSWMFLELHFTLPGSLTSSFQYISRLNQRRVKGAAKLD
jgi:hypothetical protein